MSEMIGKITFTSGFNKSIFTSISDIGCFRVIQKLVQFLKACTFLQPTDKTVKMRQ